MSIFSIFKTKTIEKKKDNRIYSIDAYANYLFIITGDLSVEIINSMAEYKQNELGMLDHLVFFDTVIVMLHLSKIAFSHMFPLTKVEMLHKEVVSKILYAVDDLYDKDNAMLNMYIEKYQKMSKKYEAESQLTFTEPIHWESERSIANVYIQEIMVDCGVYYDKDNMLEKMKFFVFVGFASMSLTDMYALLSNLKNNDIIAF